MGHAPAFALCPLGALFKLTAHATAVCATQVLQMSLLVALFDGTVLPAAMRFAQPFRLRCSNAALLLAARAPAVRDAQPAALTVLRAALEHAVVRTAVFLALLM